MALLPELLTKIRQLGLTVLNHGAVHLKTKSVVVYLCINFTFLQALQREGKWNLVMLCSLLQNRQFKLSVRLSVRLSVCSLLRRRLNVFLPQLPKVGCPIFLEIWNPWGKVMERSGLRFEHFLFKSCLKLPQKKSLIFCWFCLTKHGGSHASRWNRDLWSKGVSLILSYLPFKKKIGFLGILGSPGNHASRWIRDLWLKGVSLILAYF